MRVTKTEERIQEVEVVTAIMCDRCGSEATTSPWTEDLNNFHHIQVSGGYGTQFPCDMCSISIDVCSRCLEIWVREFQNKQILEDGLYGLRNSSD